MDFLTKWERQSKIAFQCLTLRYDLGSELVSNRFRSFLAERGIIFERAVRQTPQQIGHAERSDRTVGESAATQLALAQLAEHHLPNGLWGFAIITATYLANLVPREGTNGGKPRLELFSGKRIDVSHLRVPFCEAYPLKLKDDRRFKYESRGS
jgi:hypothetical protein